MTPQEERPKLTLALSATNLGIVYFKREDLHPYKSHKGRSIPFMIDWYKDKGSKDFVISSSGNAALAALLYIQEWNSKNTDDALSLTIFVGEKIAQAKFDLLKSTAKDSHVSVTQTTRPQQSAFEASKRGKTLLRQSTDEVALLGYATLAEELGRIQNLEAIFIATSSGTTAEALHDFFKKGGVFPQIHIVQTTGCNPIAREFEPYPLQEISFADAIVDRTALRKEKVINAVSASKGFGWIVSNQEIADAVNLVEQHEGLKISPNGALSVAGLTKALSKNWQWKGAVVCVITGR